jgi:cysteinyl-tRNA synthetase
MRFSRTILCILIGAFFSAVSISYGDDKDYKQLMRDFVKDISSYAKSRDPDFIIIPQNGHELMRERGEQEGRPSLDYIHAVDGAGQEDLFYGYEDDNVATPQEESDYLVSFLDAAKANGVVILVTDYCWDKGKMDDSFKKTHSKGISPLLPQSAI